MNRRALLFAALWLLAPAFAFARAGGGENYEGPGGGGDGGDGGDGAIIWFAIRIIIWAFRVNPLLGLLLTCVFVGGAIVFARTRPGPATRRAVATLDRERLIGDEQAGRTALATLIARDPGFSEAAFLDRVRQAFPRVQEAWSRGDLRPARPFLSDSVWNRFQVLIALNRQRGIRNVVSDVQVLGARTLAVVPGKEFDEIHVCIDARARDLDVVVGQSETDAAAALKAAARSEFVEVWSFLRRAGTRTRAGSGALEGSCPSCGAALALAEVTACGHCGSLVNSGSFDWVLAKITQVEGWSRTPAAAVSGLPELLARDPALSRVVLEDRGSLLFWRWLEAQVTGATSGLHKLAAPELVAAQAAARAKPVALSAPAVGGLDLVRITSDDDWDRVHLQVRWSAREAGARFASPRTHFLVLRRKSGVRTRVTDLATARCPQCGAPLSRTDSPRCDYCDADLSAASDDFVLEAVLTQADWAGHWGRKVPEAAPTSNAPSGDGTDSETSGDDARINENMLPDPGVPAGREWLIHALVQAAAADGRITPGEARLLRNAARRFGVAPAKLAEWMERAPASSGQEESGAGVMPVALLVRSLALAGLVDGRIDRRERALMDRVAAKGGLDAVAVSRILEAQRERIARGRVAAAGGKT